MDSKILFLGMQALGYYPRSSTGPLSPEERGALRYCQDRGIDLDQIALESKEQQRLEEIIATNTALLVFGRLHVEGVGGPEGANAVQYGIRHGLFTQEQVDERTSIYQKYFENGWGTLGR